MKLERARSFSDGVLAVLSVVTTPLILFVCSTNSLYLQNQVDLGHQVKVLFPFVCLFAAVSGFGLILLFLSRYQVLRLVLWGYYLLGPFFLIYSALRSLLTATMDFPVSLGIIGFLYVCAIVAAHRKVPVTLAAKVFGWMSVVLFLHEGFSFATKFESRVAGLSSFSSRETSSITAQHRMPNIYHIVFDEYQTDMFQFTLSPKVKQQLSGFTYFPNNTALFGRTRMSLASIFLGRGYAYDRPQIEYLLEAYNGRESSLHELVNAGYDTYAFLYLDDKHARTLFHHVIFHRDYAGYAYISNSWSLFRNLWIYANFPVFITDKFLRREEIEQLKNQNLLPDIDPLISYASFNKYLEAERYLPPSGRYTFMHLIVPHFPNIFHSDCSCGERLENGQLPRTTVTEQSNCATKMILDFVTCLKDLGRFDSSVIVISADHGSGYEVVGDELVNIGHKGAFSPEWSKTRSRALLLVKAPGNGNPTGALKVSYAETTLLDIAPTILECAGISTDLNFDGVSVMRRENASVGRKRYYHFYKKKASRGWTDEVTRFIIEGDEIRKDKVIGLTNNPRKVGEK